MFQPGDRVRWESLGDDGLPMVQYGFVRGVNGDASRIAVMLDGNLNGDTIVSCDELATVSITNIELRLRGNDLLADTALRQGLVNLWSAEADEAGLEIRALEFIDDPLSGDSCTLAEMRSGGRTYVLRAMTQSANEVWVKADPTSR